MNARVTEDFSLITLLDGDTPKNRGQLKKIVLSQEIKSLTNLDKIVSGRAAISGYMDTGKTNSIRENQITNIGNSNTK